MFRLALQLLVHTYVFCCLDDWIAEQLREISQDHRQLRTRPSRSASKHLGIRAAKGRPMDIVHIYRMDGIRVQPHK